MQHLKISYGTWLIRVDLKRARYKVTERKCKGKSHWKSMKDGLLLPYGVETAVTNIELRWGKQNKAWIIAPNLSPADRKYIPILLQNTLVTAGITSNLSRQMWRVTEVCSCGQNVTMTCGITRAKKILSTQRQPLQRSELWSEQESPLPENTTSPLIVFTPPGEMMDAPPSNG